MKLLEKTVRDDGTSVFGLQEISFLRFDAFFANVKIFYVSNFPVSQNLKDDICIGIYSCNQVAFCAFLRIENLPHTLSHTFTIIDLRLLSGEFI